MDIVFWAPQLTDVSCISLLTSFCLARALKRDSRFPQQDRTTAEQREAICSERRLESNILRGKWGRCRSRGACGVSVGSRVPSLRLHNKSVPFSPLSDHSLNGLISVGATLWRNSGHKFTPSPCKSFTAFQL